VLALDKPSGVSMATSRAAGKSEDEVLDRLLRACGEAPRPGLRLVHRLDVGTSGVVLLAKGEEAHRALSLAFQERRVAKAYRALVYGHPVPARGLLEAPLARDPRDGRRMVESAGGKRAVTGYRTLRRYPGLADLEILPETGRTHQIRVHLASRGHPIAGDDLYGAATRWRGVRAPRPRESLRALAGPLLHAERLSVPEMGLELAAPLPAAYVQLLALLAAE